MSSVALHSSHQVIHNFIFRIAGYIIGFWGNVFFARVLGVDQYGLFALGLTVIAAMEALVCLGIPRVIVREIGRGSNNVVIHHLLNTGLVWTASPSILVGLFLYVAASWLSTSVFHDPGLEPIFSVLAVFLPLIAVSSVMVGTFEGLQLSAYSLAIKEVLGRMAKICLFAGIGLVFSFSSVTLAWAYVCGQLLVVCVFVASLRAHLVGANPFRWHLLPWSYQRKMLGYSLVLGGSIVTNMVWATSASLLIGFFLTSGQVGLYNVAQNLAALVIFGLGTVNIVVMPLASKAFGNHNREHLQYMYHVSSNVITIITIPVFITFLLFSRVLLSFYGQGFLAAESAFHILCVATLINAITGANYPFIIMSEHYRFETYISIASMILNILACFLLIPLYGLMGAACGYLASQAFVNVSRCIVLFKHYKITPFSRTYWRYFFLIPAMLLIYQIVSWRSVIPEFMQMILFAVCVLVLSAAVFYYAVASREEKVLVNTLVHKYLRKLRNVKYE